MGALVTIVSSVPVASNPDDVYTVSGNDFLATLSGRFTLAEPPEFKPTQPPTKFNLSPPSTLATLSPLILQVPSEPTPMVESAYMVIFSLDVISTACSASSLTLMDARSMPDPPYKFILESACRFTCPPRKFMELDAYMSTVPSLPSSTQDCPLACIMNSVCPSSDMVI